MGANENPFTPSFGEVPEHFAGRKLLIESVDLALKSERRKPELSTILSGARGTGKTALLSLVAQKAEACGWIAADTTAGPGMLEDIELETRRKAAHILQQRSDPQVTRVGIPNILDVSIGNRAEQPTNWRTRMTDIIEELNAQGVGLLITVDEIDPDLDEQRQLAAVYQHFVREGRRVALFMAGLPHNVSSLISDKSVSFLRRAQISYLGRIEDYEIEAALERTVVENERTISPSALDNAVQAIDGFPFAMQLVGYRAWNINPNSSEISESDIDRGIELAKREMNSRILESTYRELSPTDVLFLKCMLPDEGESKIANIQERMERSSSQVAQYRKRLIDAGIIGERSRGVVGFDLPFFREYLIDRLEE